MTDDRAVRLALEVGRLMRENERLLAAVERVRALADRWAREAVERGPFDEVYTDGVAAMLRAALGAD